MRYILSGAVRSLDRFSDSLMSGEVGGYSQRFENDCSSQKKLKRALRGFLDTISDSGLFKFFEKSEIRSQVRGFGSARLQPERPHRNSRCHVRRTAMHRC